MAIDALYWSSPLILNFEGSGSTFTDISGTPKTPTVSGSAQISTAQFKTGSASGLFASGTSDYLTYASNAGYDFGLGDFCVEFWWRPVSATVSYGLIALGTPAIATLSELGFAMIHYGGTTLDGVVGKVRAAIYSGGVEYKADTLLGLAAGTWYHLAFVRNAGTIKLYLNGISQNSLAANVTITAPVSRELRVGRYSSGSPIHANGNFDGLRITKGAARYTADFSPSTDLFEATTAVTGTAALSAPSPVTSLRGAGTGPLTAPSGVAYLRGAGAFFGTNPSPTLQGVGHDASRDNLFEGAAPVGQLAARAGGTGRFIAPDAILSASGTTTIVGGAGLSSPMGLLSARGRSGGTGRAALSGVIGILAMYGGARASVNAVVGRLSASGKTGSVGRASLEAPSPSLDAIGTSRSFGSAHLVAPMLVPGPYGRVLVVAPSGRLSAAGHTVVVITYEAYAVNLKPGDGMPHQVTRYTGMPFNQIIRHRNAYYGVADDGLYLLGGDLDGSAKISWALGTGITDFGSTQSKVARETIMGAKLGPTVSASVSIGEAANVTYAAQILRGDKAQNHRVKYGKGLDARYWSFGFADVAGSDINIDTLEFDARETGRKL